ncbi:sugar fermentation stimulation protein A [Desulfobotulus alkaliphilus]|uniref:Sugar fermentation stimulation protein homolog n=1 Tax=Desulfobotulus alkaliphilus TaxID=622671 RepID=A0A562S2D5_9BACT|nr:DNA/RNA nuclease SfsA [Desulfobotulus alkaliphilus]TWI75519.1 sugar fermentation stimulation protein A [Desulfobotulus alkaliphilus]
MHPEAKFLEWPPLIKGTLIRRYKRFLADILLDTGETITAHCANSGAMTHCSEAGRPVWVAHEPGPKRKLSYTWYLIQMEESLVGVHTQIPNRLVSLAIKKGDIPELGGYENITREVKVKNSRMDILLSDSIKKDCFVEVKNCTQILKGLAAFPDAVTTRGKRHMEELAMLAENGKRAVVFFLVQREDAKGFTPADTIDPAYAKALRRASDCGVEILCYDVRMNLEGIRIHGALPVFL